jgi:hypothetical protein
VASGLQLFRTSKTMTTLRRDRPREILVREPPELHALGCFVHGALTALHALGAVYNCRRRNWWDVAAHVAAALYDARSVRHHHRTEQIARRRALAAATTPGGSDYSETLAEEGHPLARRIRRAL